MITKKSSLYLMLGAALTYSIGAFILSNRNTLPNISPIYAAPIVQNTLSPIWFLIIAGVLLGIVIWVNKK